MKKSELVKMFANHNSISQAQAEHWLNQFANLIEDVVAMGESMSLPGILSIGVKVTKPRRAYDFQTGEMKLTTPKTVPDIKVGSRLKEVALTAPVK